jgi:metal-responsive CopG/Arc/MetJ family transcriptional regulator
MKQKNRAYRLQVDMSEEDYRAIEDFWFRERLPTRAAAIRELLRRALARDSAENSN